MLKLDYDYDLDYVKVYVTSRTPQLHEVTRN